MLLTKSSLFVLALASILCGRFVQAQTIGEEKWVKGPTYGASCIWNESDAYETSWQIPFEGWVVVEYKNHNESDYGKTSFNVSYQAFPGRYVSSEALQQQYDAAVQTAFQYGFIKVANDLQEESQSSVAIVKQYENARNTIFVRVKVRGNGNPLDRKGASYKGWVEVRLKYIGAPGNVGGANDAIRLIKLKTWRVEYPNRTERVVDQYQRVQAGQWQRTLIVNGQLREQYALTEMNRTPRFIDLDNPRTNQTIRINANGSLDILHRSQGKWAIGVYQGTIAN